MHYGEILLWESEASGELALQAADPTRGNGVWIYDCTLGVPVYVNQNPWSFFDPDGLERLSKDSRSDDDIKDEIGKNRNGMSGLREALAKVKLGGKTRGDLMAYA